MGRADVSSIYIGLDDTRPSDPTTEELAKDGPSPSPETLRIEEMVLARLLIDGKSGFAEAQDVGLCSDSFTFAPIGLSLKP